MKKAERVKRATKRTRKARTKDYTLTGSQVEAQWMLVGGIRGLLKDLTNKYPGVWHSSTFDSLYLMADEIEDQIEHRISPGVAVFFQPPLLRHDELPPERRDSTYAGKNNLQLCSVCEERYTFSPLGICPDCFEKQQNAGGLLD